MATKLQDDKDVDGIFEFWNPHPTPTDKYHILVLDYTNPSLILTHSLMQIFPHEKPSYNYTFGFSLVSLKQIIFHPLILI